mmetsp:Transcript_19373/g.39192  ORF Transcript_19373/g.39192 Transcript_19373/m.39192 type:complete len:479 (-) Transcript_19373:323-1759(-)
MPPHPSASFLLAFLCLPAAASANRGRAAAAAAVQNAFFANAGRRASSWTLSVQLSSAPEDQHYHRSTIPRTCIRTNRSQRRSASVALTRRTVEQLRGGSDGRRPGGGDGGGGGDDEPELAAFRNEEEFLALGRLYNDLGQIVQSPSHLVNGTVLYRGPTMAGRHFQWPAVRVGYKRPVPGLVGGTGKPVELETLTEPIDGAEPRVFYVHNFLSQDEAEAFVEFSTSDDNPYKMARSTGGTHKAWNQGGAGATLKTRTSMNAFDVTTKLSYDVKKRAFRLLRLGGYQENMADGIQILRYELGQAYGDHHDYFPNTQSGDHQWDPSVGGSNRFATVFLYLSDVEFGGQTAFPKSAKLTAEKSEELVRRLGEAPSEERLATLVEEAGLDKNSWEDKLITKCYNQFAVPPRRGDAILFYSQTPDGHLDPSSLHGACPVLKGTKWGANLWVWNACRYSQCKEDPLQPAEELPKEMKAPFGGGE